MSTTPETKPVAPLFDTEVMAHHLMVAACFADSEDGTFCEPTDKAMRNARLYCEQFVKVAKKELLEVLDYPDYWAHPDCGGHPEAAIGHDLWLTAGGHGVGFWDRDALPTELGQKLTEQAKRFETMHHSYEQEGEEMHLSYRIEPALLLITPVGFEDPQRGVPKDAQDPTKAPSLADDAVQLRAGMDALKVALFKHGLEKNDPMSFRDSIGNIGAMELTVHVSPTGIRASVTPVDPDFKDWGQDSLEKGLLAQNDQLAVMLAVCRSVNEMGWEVRRGNKFGEYGNPLPISKVDAVPVQVAEQTEAKDVASPTKAADDDVGMSR